MKSVKNFIIVAAFVLFLVGIATSLIQGNELADKIQTYNSNGELLTALDLGNKTILDDGTMNPYKFPKLSGWECPDGTGKSKCELDKCRMLAQMNNNSKDICGEDFRNSPIISEDDKRFVKGDVMGQ